MIMRFLVLVFTAITTIAVFVYNAYTVDLIWNASTTPGITNYVIHYGRFDLKENRTNLGTNLTLHLVLEPGFWSFAVSCEKDGVNSGMSPSISYRDRNDLPGIKLKGIRF